MRHYPVAVGLGGSLEDRGGVVVRIKYLSSRALLPKRVLHVRAIFETETRNGKHDWQDLNEALVMRMDERKDEPIARCGI